MIFRLSLLSKILAFAFKAVRGSFSIYLTI